MHAPESDQKELIILQSQNKLQDILVDLILQMKMKYLKITEKMYQNYESKEGILKI